MRECCPFQSVREIFRHGSFRQTLEIHYRLRHHHRPYSLVRVQHHRVIRYTLRNSKSLGTPLLSHTSGTNISGSDTSSFPRISFLKLPLQLPKSNSFRSHSSFCASHSLNLLLSFGYSDRVVSDPDDRFFSWHPASEDAKGGSIGVLDDERHDVAVVLLGWLGSKPKHFRRYMDMYNSRGIHAITFVVAVQDVLFFSSRRGVEKRIAVLAQELELWLSDSGNDAKERSLIFHTFSNTGWLIYGYLLNKLQGRKDLVKKIKGCVIDSGGDPELNPKVWAAGFCAALLKKNSTSVHSATEGTERNGSIVPKVQVKEYFLMETLLLSALEKLFSALLNLPYVNQRLTKIISTLSKDQPDCPQLYLYSRVDKVIPFQSVEFFIEGQMRTGRKIRSFNFGSSPHVDHFRYFPDIYASKIHDFLDECLVPSGLS